MQLRNHDVCIALAVGGMLSVVVFHRRGGSEVLHIPRHDARHPRVLAAVSLMEDWQTSGRVWLKMEEWDAVSNQE